MNKTEIVEPQKEKASITLTGEDGIWKSSMEGMITPRDLSRIIRVLKVDYRLHIRKLKLKGD